MSPYSRRELRWDKHLPARSLPDSSQPRNVAAKKPSNPVPSESCRCQSIAVLMHSPVHRNKLPAPGTRTMQCHNHSLLIQSAMSVIQTVFQLSWLRHWCIHWRANLKITIEHVTWTWMTRMTLFQLNMTKTNSYQTKKMCKLVITQASAYICGWERFLSRTKTNPTQVTKTEMIDIQILRIIYEQRSVRSKTVVLESLLWFILTPFADMLTFDVSIRLSICDASRFLIGLSFQFGFFYRLLSSLCTLFVCRCILLHSTDECDGIACIALNNMASGKSTV